MLIFGQYKTSCLLIDLPICIFINLTAIVDYILSYSMSYLNVHVLIHTVVYHAVYFSYFCFFSFSYFLLPSFLFPLLFLLRKWCHHFILLVLCWKCPFISYSVPTFCFYSSKIFWNPISFLVTILPIGGMLATYLNTQYTGLLLSFRLSGSLSFHIMKTP